MPLNELAVPGRVVGEREVRRSLEKNALRKVFLATDSDRALQDRLTAAASRCGVEVEMVDSRVLLGRACAIDRSAAAAGLLKRG